MNRTFALLLLPIIILEVTVDWRLMRHRDQIELQAARISALYTIVESQQSLLTNVVVNVIESKETTSAWHREAFDAMQRLDRDHQILSANQQELARRISAAPGAEVLR